MRIVVRRRGGFAGLDEELAAVDLRELDPGQARLITRAVGEANFFSLPDRLESDDVGADMMEYAVTVVDGDRSHTVTYDGGGGSASAGRAAGPRSVLDGIVNAVAGGR